MNNIEQAAQAIAKEAGAVWPQDAERYRRYAKAALGVQGWQPIETAPKDGTKILAAEIERLRETIATIGDLQTRILQGKKYVSASDLSKALNG